MNGQHLGRVREGGYPANSDGAANAGRHGEWHAAMKATIMLDRRLDRPVARTENHPGGARYGDVTRPFDRALDAGDRAVQSAI